VKKPTLKGYASSCNALPSAKSIKPSFNLKLGLLGRMGVIADVGQTYNSSVTYQHMVADKPDVRPHLLTLRLVLGPLSC
jgi:hypothetical protein